MDVMITCDRRTTLRVPAADLEAIDRLARTYGVSRSKYLISSALGRDLAPAGLAARVEEMARWQAAADRTFRLLGVPVDLEDA